MRSIDYVTRIKLGWVYLRRHSLVCADPEGCPLKEITQYTHGKFRDDETFSLRELVIAVNKINVSL